MLFGRVVGALVIQNGVGGQFHVILLERTTYAYGRSVIAFIIDSGSLYINL